MVNDKAEVKLIEWFTFDFWDERKKNQIYYI